MISPGQKDPGILPLAKSTFDDPALFTPSIEVSGYKLPGHGDEYGSCGDTLVFGCLGPHNQSNLDRDVVGKIFVDLRKRTCLRAECPICYEKWAGKEAGKIEHRMKQWRGGKPIHVTISAPTSLWNKKLTDLRAIAYKIAKEIGVFGGSCIIHPFRERCKICNGLKDTATKRCENCGCEEFLWWFSPHFHILGYGWIHGHKVKAVYEKTGWISRNLGIRDSIGATALYQLSHCGVHKKHHSVTWFGRMSYNKLRVDPQPVEKKRCPLCDGELIKLRWVGEEPCPIESEGQYFLELEFWVEGFVDPW